MKVWETIADFFKRRSKWEKKVEKRFSLLEESMKHSMKRDLIKDMKYYLKNKYISESEYKELEESVKAYEALNGNGYVHSLFKRVSDECVGTTLEVMKCQQESTPTQDTTD